MGRVTLHFCNIRLFSWLSYIIGVVCHRGSACCHVGMLTCVSREAALRFLSRSSPAAVRVYYLQCHGAFLQIAGPGLIANAGVFTQCEGFQLPRRGQKALLVPGDRGELFVLLLHFDIAVVQPLKIRGGFIIELTHIPIQEFPPVFLSGISVSGLIHTTAFRPLFHNSADPL